MKRGPLFMVSLAIVVSTFAQGQAPVSPFPVEDKAQLLRGPGAGP